MAYLMELQKKKDAAFARKAPWGPALSGFSAQHDLRENGHDDTGNGCPLFVCCLYPMILYPDMSIFCWLNHH